MTRWTPAPILGGAYSDESRPWSCQDTVNWLPVRIERPNGRSDWKLTPVPGLKVFSAFANASTDTTDRVRGLRNVEGRLYAVCGQSLFLLNADGSVDTVQENAVPGTGRVTMTHNQETGGYSLVLANGSGGWTYNSGTSTFAEITDEGFPGFKTCDFLDQYIVGISPDGLFAFHSDLANAGDYNTLDRYSAEAAPDRLVGQIVDHGQWWLFGERTTEIYTNTGASTGTFQRIPGSTIERGLAGTHAVAKLDNSVFWVGDDGVVYRANGYTPVRISTHPIEQELSRCDLSQAFCLVYEDRGHKVLYVTCPDGKTWGYDVATQEWHRRESYNRSNWRVTHLSRWGGGWLAGDELTNRLQRVAWEYQDEDGSPLVCRRRTGILHGNENRLQLHAIKLVIDSGRTPGEPRPLVQPTYPVQVYNPLTAAYVGVAVDHDYLGRFGVPPYTFAHILGTLPAGLSLASDGSLTGTPTTTGAYAWRIEITDAIGQTDTLDQGVDVAEGIDDGSGVEFEVGYSGTWFFGPAAQNGASGGSTAFYLKADTVGGLSSATPTALPSPMTSLGRISTANGKLFFHAASASENAMVSSDRGLTWSEADHPLFDTGFNQIDVYWNGTYYYWGNRRSADGIAWTTIPNFPAITVSGWYARDSDGLFLVGATNGDIHYTFDDGGTSFTQRVNPDGGAGGAWTPFESDGTRILAVNQLGLGNSYTDDLWATAPNFIAVNTGGTKKYADNVWIGLRTEINRSTDGASWAVALSITNADSGNDMPRVAYDPISSLWVILDCEVSGNNYRPHTSIDGGQNWTAGSLLYGTGGNLGFIGAGE